MRPSRLAFVALGLSVPARQRILATNGDGVILGAGVAGMMFCVVLLGAG